MIASMSQVAPHIWTGMIAFVCGPISGANSLGGDRDALVDIDDDRNGSNRQNRRRGRHIGVGGNDDFVAWANAHCGQPAVSAKVPLAERAK